MLLVFQMLFLKIEPTALLISTVSKALVISTSNSVSRIFCLWAASKNGLPVIHGNKIGNIWLPTGEECPHPDGEYGKTQTMLVLKGLAPACTRLKKLYHITLDKC